MDYISSEHVFESFRCGAMNVISNREFLNKINVFPINDGDTGSNLALMMHTIIEISEKKKTVKETLESFANAALIGARGNSGIIFAQYLSGLSEELENIEVISAKQYASASKKAVKYAYEAIENPVEGTILTLMNTWGEALQKESKYKNDFAEIIKAASKIIEMALYKTKEQLNVLKKANVVDSGAQGFVFFIQGIFQYVVKKIKVNKKEIVDKKIKFTEFYDIHDKESEYRYCTEALIRAENQDRNLIKNDLRNFGDSLVVASNKNYIRIHIHTNRPDKIFDYLYQKGKVLEQKIEDMFMQRSVVGEKRNEIAILTDSIADISKDFLDSNQIHVINLNIILKNRNYLDKLTIDNERALDFTKNEYPSFSQPSNKQIEKVFSFLLDNYKEVIVVTVSKYLSGTYNAFKLYIDSNKLNSRVTLINSKQNSGAEGLIVKKCSELVDMGLTKNEIEEKINISIKNTKILVKIQTLENMIKSGRLSVKLGLFAKKIGLNPIVTLDENGRGKIEGIAFSSKGSERKIIKKIKKLSKRRRIESYNIVYVDNFLLARKFANKINKIVGFKEDYITQTSSIIAIGAGINTIAISYTLKED